MLSTGVIRSSKENNREMRTKNDEIRDWYVVLPDSDKQIYLALVMAQLTIHGRAFGLELPAEQQARSFMGLNELQHQISNHSVGIGMRSERYPDDTFLEVLREKALHFGISAHLAQALDFARTRDYWERKKSAKEISNPSKEDVIEDQAKLEALRAAVQAGFDSGVAEGDVIARIRERIRRRAEESE